MLKRPKRTAALLLCAVLLLTALAPLTARADAREEKVVRVGWYESPFNETDQFGRRSGYAYEFQRKIAAYTGWTYEYVTASWPELYQMLVEGEIDLMSDVSYTPERAELMLFPAQPMGEERYYLFVPAADNRGISPEDVTSLNGKRVGVNRGSYQKSLFEDWMKSYGVKAKIIELDTDEDESVRLLFEGAFDAYVTIDSFGGHDGTVPLFKVGASSFYFAVNKDRPDLLQELNAAMNRIQDENRHYIEQLDKTYLRASGANLFLTQNELNWLDAHGTIRVGYRTGYLAFCDKDPKTGKLVGALAEFLNLASTCLTNAEFDFQTIPFDSTQDALDALKAGEIDCVFPINISPYDAEQMDVLDTDAVMQSEMYAVVRAKDRGSFKLTEDYSVAIRAGEPSHLTFLMDHFPSWTTVVCDSTEGRFRAVSAGEADCTLISNYRMNHNAAAIEKYGLATVSTGTYVGFHFALRDQDVELYAILNKLIDIVPSAAVNASLTEWSTEEQAFSLLKYMREHVNLIVLVFAAILLIAFVVLMRILRSEKRAKLSEQEANKALEQVSALNEEQKRRLDEIDRLNARLTARQAELNAALKSAEQASRAKTTFLSSMSHEIRTPMNAILGFTGLAKTHIDDREQVLGDIDKIDAAGRHLLSLINDVLDMSRIESGRMTLRDEAFSFRELLDQVNTVVGSQCAEAGLAYDFRILSPVSRAFYGDDLKLKQVFINILGNAVKFTPAPGTVSFTVEQINAFDDQRTLRFVMRDTGIGMDKEFIPKIFNAFSQEQSGAENKYGSTGLGMAITKNIVQMMNGRIEVESQKGVGSTFTVTVSLRDAGRGTMTDLNAEPAQPESGAAEQEPGAGEQCSLAGLRVLIAEDMEINAELLREILSLEKVESDWAENGKLTVERFQQSEPGYYDAILMDIRMPVMDGLEATAAIRRLNKPDARTVPIIAMSANAFAEDVQRSLQAGMNAHLSKPVEPDRLFDTLRKLAGKQI